MADHPVTAAVRWLRAHGVTFESHVFPYEEKGGTRHSSEQLGVPERRVIKTLIMEDDAKRPLVVLMHGDREVSTKALARHLGVKAVVPCQPKTAEKHSGYVVGGTSPFGLKTPMPVYAERTIFELPEIYINGGKRGFLVRISPDVLRSPLGAKEVEVATG